MLHTLAIESYRSLRRLVLPLSGLNVVTGGNGSGKSSLYRSLRLLADGSRNGMVGALAREGGLPSVLWAGPAQPSRGVREGRYPLQGTASSRTPVALRLGFGEDDFGYAIDLGLPPPAASAFALDPEIKRESIWSGPVLRPSAILCDRLGGFVRIREDSGGWSGAAPIGPFDSMLSEFADPDRAPELLTLRDRIRSWRFYDQFRTDASAPARASHIGTRTPVLGHEGTDVAAVLQTIRENGDDRGLDEAVSNAFPGSRLEVDRAPDGRLGLLLHQPGLLRPLAAAELSDGTLRYLLWIAALLSPRPARLLVLNEPETSLHPELLGSLGALIAAASARSQVIVVTHSGRLIEAIESAAGPAEATLTTIELVKQSGETQVAGRDPFDQPPWSWPKR